MLLLCTAAFLVLVGCRSWYSLGTLLSLARWPVVGVSGGILLTLLWGRRLRFGALALVPMAVVAGEWGVTRWSRARPEVVVERGRHFTVLTHNMLYRGATVAQSAKMLAAEDADLVALQEFTPEWQDQLAPLLDQRYRYQALAPRPGASGYGLYSKHPIANVKLLGPRSWPFAQCFDVLLPEGPLRTCNVHFSSPAGAFARKTDRWAELKKIERRRNEEWAELRQYLSRVARRGDMELLLGDLNTLESEPLYRNIAREYVDAYRELRSDSGATWPNNLPVLPFRIARIDYVLSRGPLSPLAASVPSESGSDHMAVKATFALPGKGHARR